MAIQAKSVVHQVKAAALSGLPGAKINNVNVTEAQGCAILATNALTGQPFSRSFPNYAALEQWMAADGAASNLDLTNMRIVGAGTF